MISAEEAVNQIIKEIDKRTLLGAAYDCMTEKSKEKFNLRLKEIVESADKNLR